MSKEHHSHKQARILSSEVKNAQTAKDNKASKLEIEIIFVGEKLEIEKQVKHDCFCLCHNKQAYNDLDYPKYFMTKYRQDEDLLEEDLSHLDIATNTKIVNQSWEFSRFKITDLTEKVLLNESGKKLLVKRKISKNEVLHPIEQDFNDYEAADSNGEADFYRKLTSDEIELIKYLKISSPNKSHEFLKKYFPNRRQSFLKLQWEKRAVMILQQSLWTKRELWFYYLFRRNLGKNVTELRRIFFYKKQNEVTYIWHRELSSLRYEYEFLIKRILKNPFFLNTGVLSPLEVFLIRRRTDFNPSVFKLVGKYLRKRTHRFWVAKTLEELFHLNGINSSLLEAFWIETQKNERVLNLSKISTLVYCGDEILWMKRDTQD